MSALQLAAFPPPAAPPQWGLIVDEVLLNATGSPARGWWFPHAASLEGRGRARQLAICPTGAVTEYGPWDKDDAEFMRDHMIERGMHPKALKLRTWMPESRRVQPCRAVQTLRPITPPDAHHPREDRP